MPRLNHAARTQFATLTFLTAVGLGCTGTVTGLPVSTDSGVLDAGLHDLSTPDGGADTGRPDAGVADAGHADVRANARLRDLPDNTALDLGRYPCTQPADNPGGCAAVTDYSRFNYDPIGHQLLLFGGGHAGAYGSEVEVFDFQALTWSPAYQSTTCANQTPANFDGAHAAWVDTHSPLARHVWDNMVVANVQGRRSLVILSSGGLTAETCHQGAQDPFPPLQTRVEWYDIETKRWTFGQTKPDDFWYYASASEADPVSGKIVNFGGHGLFFFDPNTEAITSLTIDPASQYGRDDLGYSNNLVYFPPTDRFYYLTRTFAGHNDLTLVFELVINRTANTAVITQLTTVGAPASDETGWAYDSKNHVIGGGILNGVFYAFDPATLLWDAQTMHGLSTENETPDSVVFHALDYDPIDNVFIYLSDPHRRTWAYKYK